jgi:two-component system, chemotaxis family, chemotaxis protein CheY
LINVRQNQTARRNLTMLHLLIADPSQHDCDTACGLFADLGFSVVLSPSALDAMARCEAMLPDLIIIDAGLDGALELISAIRLMSGGKSTRILYGVADADLRKLMAAKHAGADDFLLKPYDMKVLHALFDEMLTQSDAA